MIKLPIERKNRFWLAVLATTSVAIVLTVWGIYGIGEYGMALFILVPFLIGFQSTVMWGREFVLTKNEGKKVAFSSVGVFLVALFIFAFEGLICILMATPIIFIVCYLGMLVGFSLMNKSSRTANMSIGILIVVFPLTGNLDKAIVPSIEKVTTSIVINSSPENVWKNVIQFPQLSAPSELIFKAGISYPINAKIHGKGIGAIRYCNFNTGSFVEPITKWEENKLLAFSVRQQPVSITELSFYDINAPHLHDYFVSKKGQFKLIDLGNGKTKLEGTTWYVNDIKPQFYWNIWSSWIIHSIHDRVLDHIKTQTEKKEYS
jgi:hypothetical protein